MSKLILGTASFGQPYGIKGDPIPDEKELEKIARIAWDGGIRVIHTSWQYNLPKICEAIFSEFEWIKKDKEFPDLFSWNNEYSTGMSYYDPVEYRHFCGSKQVIIPVNVLDNRFLNRKHNFVVIARSVFLQGLLLMDNLPGWVSWDVWTKIVQFRIACKFNSLKLYEAALGYVLGLDEIDYVIVGVNSAEQLKQLLEVKSLKWDYDFSITDENVLDPRRWPTLENQLKRNVETSTAIEGIRIKL